MQNKGEKARFGKEKLQTIMLIRLLYKERGKEAELGREKLRQWSRADSLRQRIRRPWSSDYLLQQSVFAQNFQTGVPVMFGG